MKIDVCLLASNENPMYYMIYPYVKLVWEKLLNIKCILVYIGESIPKELENYNNSIILFKPIKNLHTAFIAQCIRLLYPCIMDKYKNGILICDIDLIPLNNYLIKKTEGINDDYFVNFFLKDKLIACEEINIIYNVASYSVWRDIFKIHSLDDIIETLQSWYKFAGQYHYDPIYRSKCKGYHTDQKMFYKYINSWEKKNTHFHIEKDDGIQVIDFSPKILKNKKILKNIEEGKYVDIRTVRCPRLNVSQYIPIILEIIKLVLKENINIQSIN
jgi:hypothetical protein